MLEKIKPLLGPFYSSSFYAELVAKKQGIGALFLAIIVLINIVGIAVVTHAPLTALMEEQKAFFESLPDATIKNGELSFDMKEPQTFSLFENVDGGPLVVVLDTLGEPLDESSLLKKMRDENISVFAARNGVMVYSQQNYESRFYPITKEKDLVITHDKWMSFCETIEGLIAPIIIVFFIVFLSIYHLFTAWVGAVLLLIVVPLLKIEVPFAGLMRVSFAAKVPVAVFFSFLPQHIAATTVIWFGFALFGLLAYKKATATSLAA